MAGKPSFDETVARLALARLTGEAGQVAEMRGLPPEVRFATPEEELKLYFHWDPNVDPKAVLTERFQKYTQDGLEPAHALTEALLDASAAGFPNKLKMGQAGGRTDLTSQVKYHEAMAAKYPEYQALVARDQQPPPPDVGAPDAPPPAPMQPPAGAASSLPSPLGGQ